MALPRDPRNPSTLGPPEQLENWSADRIRKLPLALYQQHVNDVISRSTFRASLPCVSLPQCELDLQAVRTWTADAKFQELHSDFRTLRDRVLHSLLKHVRVVREQDARARSQPLKQAMASKMAVLAEIERSGRQGGQEWSEFKANVEHLRAKEQECWREVERGDEEIAELWSRPGVVCDNCGADLIVDGKITSVPGIICDSCGVVQTIDGEVSSVHQLSTARYTI